jgi:hypothetical protein
VRTLLYKAIMLTYVKARPAPGAHLIDIGNFDNRRRMGREPDQADLNIQNICDRLASFPPTNPTVAAKVIVYARTPLRSCPRSIEHQIQSADAWLAKNGLVAAEQWIEHALGTQINSGLELILDRAEQRKPTLLVMRDYSRIARRFDALVEFMERAKACDLVLQLIRQNPCP